jgi:hypothetical protein
MGTALSIPDDFDLGRYWIGKDVYLVRKGLSLHFKERLVKSHSQDDLQSLLEEDRAKDQLTVLYDPQSMKATRILIG